MLRSNQLPYGAFGQLLFAEQAELMQPLIATIHAQKQGNFSVLDINCLVRDCHIIGRIKNIQSDGILQWRSSKLTIKDGMMLWIEHLLYCLSYSSPNVHNRIYGRDNTQWQFKPVSKELANKLLEQLVDGYLSGINQPLFMPLQSCWNWLDIVYHKQTGLISDDVGVLAKARHQFITYWQGNMVITAECDDYYLRLYPDLTDELIDTAIQSTIDYLLPIITYRDTEYAN